MKSPFRSRTWFPHLCLLQIQECTITFNAKISSVANSENALDVTAGGSLTASGGYGAFSASLTASFSVQKTEKNSNSEQREFSMQVYVRAVQDEMPAGMAKLLGVLEDAILVKNKAAA